MPILKIKDGDNLRDAQFPDGMSAENIREFLRRKYSQQRMNGESDLLTPADNVAAPYEPTLAERMGQGVSNMLTDSGIISDQYGAQNIGENLTTLGEFLPGVGDATAGDEFGRAAHAGSASGMALAGLGAIPVVGDLVKKGAKKVERLYHGSPVEFDEFDPSRMGDRLTSLGLGHYLTPNKATAEQYGDNLMEFDVDTTDILDWQNMTKAQRDDVEEALMKIVPPDRLAGFGKKMFEVLPANKEGAKRFKELKEQTKDVYHHSARAKTLTDDEIMKNHPGLIDEIGDNDNVVEWREGGDLSSANDQNLMTLMNEYSPELARYLGYKGSRFSDQVAIYDSKLAKRFKPQAQLSTADAGRLYKTHNITKEGLAKADEFGGIPVPSLAIAGKDTGFDNFGEISLIGSKDSFAKDPTFAADVYSPRTPKGEHKIDAAQARREGDRVEGDIDPRIDSGFSSQFSPDRLSDDIDRLGESIGNKASFLKGIGQLVDADKFTSKPPKFKEPAWVKEHGFSLDGLITFKRFDDPEFAKKADNFVTSLNPERDIEDWWDGGELSREGQKMVLSSLRQQKMSKQAADAGPQFDRLKARDEINKRVKKNQQSFDSYISDQKGRISKGKQFSKWNPDKGTSKKFDYNLDNAVKLMKGNIRGGEGFNYGVGSIRAQAAPQLKSMKQIMDRRGQIVGEDQMTMVKEGFDSRLDNLYEDLKGNWAYGSEPGYNDFAEGLEAAAKGDFADFKGLTPEQKGEMAGFFDELANAPTNYFEIKPQRAVDVGEFYGAAVPYGTPKAVIDGLRAKGLKIERYKPDQRMDAIEKLNVKSKGNVFFSGGGAALLYGATRGDNEEDSGYE